MVRTVTSTSKDEVSVVLAEFEYEKSLDSAATDVANALARSRPVCHRASALHRYSRSARRLSLQ
jgi:multidrug efflux pump subunit AcrB